jgi:thioredoxin 1
MKAITDASFQTEIARGLTVIKCTADWCQPCKTLQPVLDTVAYKYPSTKFVSLDVDANPRVPDAYGVQGLPTLLFFRDGQYKGTMNNQLTERRISEAIQQL